jgi:hypothetical protein
MLTRFVPAVLLLAMLGGCTAEPHGLTLVETKSPVQLLRNDAWYRLPSVMVKEDSETSDSSAACDDDPDGKMRLWQSSTIALVNNSQAPRVVLAGDNLAATFVEQGWVAERSDSEIAVLTVLTKPSSVARIEIEAVAKTEEHRASIRITASGPCVLTAGANSDEVRDLESDSRSE